MTSKKNTFCRDLAVTAVSWRALASSTTGFEAHTIRVLSTV